MKKIIMFFPILALVLALCSCGTKITKEDATNRFLNEYYTVDSYNRIDYVNSFVNPVEGLSIYTNRYNSYLTDECLSGFVSTAKMFAMEKYCYDNKLYMSSTIDSLYFSDDSDVTYRVTITLINEELKTSQIVKSGTLSLFKSKKKNYYISSVSGLNYDVTDFENSVFA